MPERGFVPVSKEERRTWGAIRDTVAAAQSLTRRQRGFGLLLTVSFVYGLHSEGFDRLWVPHVLAIGLPANLQPVIWFGLASACARALGVLTVEVARRRVDMVSKESLMRALQVISVLLVVSITAIALSGHWWLALLLYCMERALHAGSQPLYYTWLNLHIDRPQVRATIFSVNSQMNAIGQVFGGPVAGAVGERLGLRAALLSSALLLLPVVPLYALLLRKSK
jgi:DHA3 family tetracycline resistance protein-like MFS transporter